MGLDAYVRIPVITDDPDAPTSKELWYGRKENEIHGWMQRQSGIEAEEFNCVPLTLTTEILDRFESAFKLKLLVPTSGFFFGAANDLDRVAEAAQDLLDVSRAAIAKGKVPYYMSWW